MSLEPPTENLGMEGETCAQCGAALATDQRYCLNCGTSRTERRLDFKKYLSGGGQAAVPAAAGGAPAAAAPAGAVQQWPPIAVVGVIGLLGVMLLLGVLIGKDDNPTTVAAAPATTTTAAAPTATTPTDTTAATKTGKNKDAAATTPGAGDVVQGGSGDTNGIAAADPNASALDNIKNGPDVVATQGQKEQLDPNGQAGAGGDAVCIGC